jgi:hypothetical protein
MWPVTLMQGTTAFAPALLWNIISSAISRPCRPHPRDQYEIQNKPLAMPDHGRFRTLPDPDYSDTYRTQKQKAPADFWGLL